MEERVFKRLDDNAAIALESLLKDDGRIFSDAKLRSGWTRFLVSLHLRMPEDIQNIREAWYRIFNKAPQHLEDEYQRIREDNYPASLEDLLSDMTTEEKEHQFARLLLSQLNSKKVGEMIHHLNWNVIELPPNAPKLLTSDRPVVRSASLGGPTGYLAIPISPNLAFFATKIERNWLVSKEKNIDQMMRRLNLSRPNFAKHLNRSVVRQAQKYVYSRDDAVLSFVDNHFGKNMVPRVSDYFLRDAVARSAQNQFS